VSSFALSPDVPAQIVQGLETDGPIPSGEELSYEAILTLSN